MKVKIIIFAIVTVTLLACSGGGGNDSGGGNSSPTLVSIDVTPSNPSIMLGKTQQFTAIGTYSDSSTKDLTSSATWTTSSAGIASIDNAGLASAASTGTTTITSALGGISGIATLTVLSSAGTTSDPDIRSLNLSKTVEIVNASRPEIIVTANRVFVVYLGIVSPRSFNVSIYNRDMTAVISTSVLVPTDPTYGGPTDIRVVSDGVYLYAFYETCNDAQSKTYLFGAKYTLDDNFARVAYTGPITQSTKFTVAIAGDEKNDDPAPLLGSNEVFVMTRIKSTLAQSGATIYRFRKFSKDLQPIEFSPGATTFDLDLSAYADGEARQSSVLFADGFYYLTVQTAVGPSSIGNDNIIWTIPADLLMVKLDSNFGYVDSRILNGESGYTEGYVTGFKSDSKYFYLTYNHVKLGTEFSSVIRVFDKSWNEVLTDKYTSVVSSALRPSIEVSTDQVIAGNIDEAASKAMIYLFDKQ